MPTPTYRYAMVDFLTGLLLAEVPLTGVNCDVQMSTAGSFQGNLSLTGDATTDLLYLAATQAGRTIIYMYRNNVVIWSGILWSRQYDSETHVLSLTGMTWESIFDHIVMPADFVQQNKTAGVIFNALITYLQTNFLYPDAVTHNQFRVSSSGSQTSSSHFSVLIPAYECHIASDSLSDIIGTAGGIEYTAVPAVYTSPTQTNYVNFKWSDTGSLNATQTPIVLDYPGAVASYSMVDNATSGAAQFFGTGAGTGNKMINTEFDGNSFSAGWPQWGITIQYPNITNLNTLTYRVQAQKNILQLPYTQPQINVNPSAFEHDEVNAFGALGTPVYINFAATDPYWGGKGKQMKTRMIGWNYTANDPSQEQVENLQYVMDAGDLS